ncbi:MAG: hypothetical protein VB071_14420 [Lawsonibacter sp.]|nr:hypothetical protein [Lawsonibacter sp.]
MLLIFGFIGLIIVLVMFPTFRCAFFHPLAVIVNGVCDLYFYLLHKEYNVYGTGELVAYTGLFGRGKTLSVVHRVVSAYRGYDGKPIWCRRRKKMVTQRIKVISNVSLSIPYENFVSLEQIVLAAEKNQEYDDEHDTLTVTLVLGDEFSVQMNSRNFKTNIDPLFLNTILTCRHYFISLYYTAQRFGHVDALLRQVTSYVMECDKLWRFQRLNQYDAWDLENATNTQLVTPLGRFCWFVKNRDYEAYNTLACVGNLKKSMKAGDMMSEEEILKLQQNTQQPNMDGVSKPSRRWIKRQQKEHK